MSGTDKLGDQWNEILKSVWNAILEDESGLQVVNPQRMREYMACEMAIREVFKGQNVRIKSNPHDMFPSMGVIEISGKEFVIKDTDLFVNATSVASNYEIYPTLDGTLHMNITFYEMTKKA